jgi:hypothetical protein
LLDLVEIVHEVLHEGDALPTGYATLRRQRVKPANGVVVIVEVLTGAHELDAILFGLGTAALCLKARAHLSQRLQALFKNGWPSHLAAVGDEV